ncbi:hypothetical protein GCM10027579_01250 [Calidifontibacter terrae]
MDNELWALGGHVPHSSAQAFGQFVRRVLPVVSGVVLLGHFLLRRRWRAGALAVIGWAATVALVYALREVLPRPYLGDHGGFPVNSFPSTHVALAATPLVAVILDRTADRLTTAACLFLVAAAMVGNTMLLVHRASDTLGAVAVAVGLLSLLDLLTPQRQPGRY